MRTLHQLREERRKKLGLPEREKKQAMYNRPSWRRASKRYRQEHPLCAICFASGKTTPAYCVDHITPHNGSETLFWRESNWQSLCRSCHQAKSQEERKDF